MTVYLKKAEVLKLLHQALDRADASIAEEQAKDRIPSFERGLRCAYGCALGFVELMEPEKEKAL